MGKKQNYIVDMQLMEYIGHFRILNPNEPKIYGINIFKLAVKVELFFLTV